MWFWMAVLLLPAAHSLFYEDDPNRCWMNKDTLFRTVDISGVCPLRDSELKRPVYCSIKLSPVEIENQRCRRCAWKESTEKLCQPTKDWKRRHCCCKKPMCNKVIYEDALPGWAINWETISDYRTNATKICIKAAFNNVEGWKRFKAKNKTGNLTFGKARPKKGFPTDVCFLRYVTNNPKQLNLTMGVPSSSDLERCNEVLDSGEPCEHNVNDNSTLCCCRGPLCNQDLYQEHAFSSIMALRLDEEQTYEKEMKEVWKKVSKIKKLWHKDEDYYNSKMIVNGCILIGTAIYILIIIILYKTCVLEDMDKRQRPFQPSKEVSVDR